MIGDSRGSFVGVMQQTVWESQPRVMSRIRLRNLLLCQYFHTAESPWRFLKRMFFFLKKMMEQIPPICRKSAPLQAPIGATSSCSPLNSSKGLLLICSDFPSLLGLKGSNVDFVTAERLDTLCGFHSERRKQDHGETRPDHVPMGGEYFG